MNTRSAKLYGLILTGGKSRRMGTDKALLEYHGIPQVAFTYGLLTKVCAKVFVSVVKKQATAPVYRDFPQIIDRPQWETKGPLAGILSAMTSYPKADWLVLGCDLPFVNEATLTFLIANRDRRRIATAYQSTDDKLPEPLCAIYETKARRRLLEFLRQDILCPRKIMINSNVRLLRQKDPRWLNNVNEPKEFRAARKKIR